MGKKQIGAITIGQAPRTDMTGDIRKYLSDTIELLEFGALDDMTLEEVNRSYAPEAGDDVLVSRMRDGKQVKMAEKHVIPLVQKCIRKAEAAGVDAILLLCTGTFPEFESSLPIIKPQPLFRAVAEKLSEGKKIGIIVPDEAQREQVQASWEKSGIHAEVQVGSPYLDLEETRKAAMALKNREIRLICLDCMGFTLEMKEAVQTITGLPVILPRTLVARILDELYS